MLENFEIDYFIFFTAFLLIMGVITTKFSSRLGVPALVLFMGVGILMGSDVLGIIYFDNPKLAQLIGIFSLVVILFEGGLQTKWSSVKAVAIPSLSLATLGVLLTTIVVAIAAKLIFDIGWVEGFLFGAIVGSTDAAAIFAVLKGQSINDRLSSTLEAESGTNDPMAVFLTLALIEMLSADSTSYLLLIGSFIWQMGVGLGLGYFLGRFASFAINKINLDSSGLYPIFALAFSLLTYSLTDLINASGLLAVYIAAIVIGNRDLTYRHSIFRFNEGFAWMMQILMFIILGLLVFPSQFLSFDLIFKGLLLSIILIFVARPVAVFLSTIKMKFSIKEKIFLSWAGLKGAVPIVLATFPMTMGIENSQLIFNVVFFVVLTSALIQGSTITMIAEKLGLNGPKKAEAPHTLELVSIGKANAEIIEVEINDHEHIINQPLKDIKFPKDVLVNAIIRKGDLVTPHGETKIKSGDILYILVSKKKIMDLKEFLTNKRTLTD